MLITIKGYWQGTQTIKLAYVRPVVFSPESIDSARWSQLDPANKKVVTITVVDPYSDMLDPYRDMTKLKAEAARKA